MKNDKLQHFAVGLLVGLAALPISYFTGLWWALWIVCFCSLPIFIGKEIFDVYKPNPTGFDKMDLLADYIGLVGGAILSFFIHGIIQIINI
jgi:VanZ family protein